MQEPATTIDKDDDSGEKNRDESRDPPQKPTGRVLKFHYATGATPLDGYTIKRGIGIGGFGEVYFATSDAGKEVALKRIQRNLDVELRGVKQCLNLKHTNLIALWDIKYDSDGEAWVIMEYVSGESLKDVIDRNPNGLPIDEVHAWFKGIAAGTTYLHDHGIVHRDLKPGNIFLDEETVKIGDYGLSKFISCSRRSGQTESVGTFHYMAPEIGKGVYGKEIDVYSLGIILFELLTGSVPFEGESSQEIIMKHLTADPELDNISDPYRKVIRRALAKDPDQRYADVKDMIAELPIDGPPIAAPAPIEEPVERLEEPVERPPAKPPVIIGPETEPETMFIGDDSDIVMGDVQEVVTAHPAGRLHTPIQPHPPVPPPAQQNTSAYASQHQRASRRKRGASKSMLYQYLKSRSQMDRLSELTGSLILSAAVCCVFSLAAMVVCGAGLGNSVQWLQIFAWLTLTSTGGSWFILSIQKFWEGEEGETSTRRFIMLAAGLVLATYAFFCADMFLQLQWPARSVGHLSSMYTASGAPSWAAYTAFLGLLFVSLRWWKQADPVRRRRVSFWDTLLCGVCAVLFAAILDFPMWGALLAMSISVGVQLSAPWINETQRNEIRDRFVDL